MLKFSKRLVSIVLFAAVLLLCTNAQALIINPIYVNAVGQTWTAERTGVINQAIADWESVILDNQTVDVTFTFSVAGTSSYLGQWSASGSASTNADIYPWTPTIDHTVTFNSSYFSTTYYTWFDPSPETSYDLPFYAYDALSVTRHELGHMLGFTDGLYFDNFSTPQQTDRWTDQISGTTFDPGGINATMAALNNLGHLADSGIGEDDLMIPSLPNDTRRKISSLDLEMLSLAHGYDVYIAPPVLLGDYSGDGIVNTPDYTTWADSFNQTGANLPADGNGDGIVDTADYTIWADHFGETLPTMVPEPVSMVMLCLGAAALLRRRK